MLFEFCCPCCLSSSMISFRKCAYYSPICTDTKLRTMYARRAIKRGAKGQSLPNTWTTHLDQQHRLQTFLHSRPSQRFTVTIWRNIIMYQFSCPVFESWTFWFCKHCDCAEKPTKTLCIPARSSTSPCGTKRSLWGQSVVHHVWCFQYATVKGRKQMVYRSGFSRGLSVGNMVKSFFGLM